jgi:hypothetical protein
MACLLTLSACGGGPADSLAMHDSKYESTGECVDDTLTGLTWERKTADPGLHDWRNTYTWYNPEEAHGELDYRGLADGGECAGSRCDTFDFVRAVNATNLCGYADWRIPLRDELLSISDLRKKDTPPTANLDYFPFMQPDEYWSSNDYSFQHDAAWGWSFRYGHDRVDWKRTPKHVRLVRGEGRQLDKVKE